MDISDYAGKLMNANEYVVGVGYVCAGTPPEAQTINLRPEYERLRAQNAWLQTELSRAVRLLDEYRALYG